MTTLLIASSLCPPIHLKPSLSFYVPKTFSVSTPNLGLSVQIIYPGPGLPSLSRQGTVPLANVPEALGISSKQLVCSMSLAKVGVHPVVFREKLVWKSTVYHYFRFVHSIRQDARKVSLKTVDRHHSLGTIRDTFPKAFNIARGEQSSRTLRTDPVVWSATLRMPCCRTW
jgi:hypothetical protein